MISLVLDTNAYTAVKKGQDAATELIRQVDSISLPIIALGELLAGFAAGNREEQNRYELEQFIQSRRVQILMIDRDTPRSYAMIYAMLRRKGRPIPTNDMWIAALALQKDLPLFSYDAHFREVDNLNVVTSTADL